MSGFSLPQKANLPKGLNRKDLPQIVAVYFEEASGLYIYITT
jgi:hypothetical protein